MISLPNETKQWIQKNNSDVFGNIAQTRNITFDKHGYLQLSNSCRAVMDNGVDVDFDEPAVILRSEDYGYFVATHDQAFQVADDKILAVRPTQIATAGVPSGDIQTDATFSNGLMVMTQDNDVDYYDPSANTWTDTDITLTATTGSQHPIEKFLSLNAFVVADVNTVKLYNNPITATPSLVVTLTIPSDFYITSLAYFNQNMYIGTMNRFGGNAFMYVWNGYGTAAQSAYDVGSNIVYDLCVHEDSIVLMNGKGQLLRFNGSGFTQLDALPVFYTNVVLSDETNVNMYHNCIKSNSDLLYINVSTSANNIKLTNQTDGIWCYDSALGFLYHRYSPTISLVDIDSIGISDVNTTTNQIVVTTAPITGTEVIYDINEAEGLAPLVDKTRYFVIKVDATHIKLATTKTNALAGTAIDITSQADGPVNFVFCPNYDFGQSICPRATAILPIERNVENPQLGTDLIGGGTLYGTQIATKDFLWTTTPNVENRGYFITPKVYTQSVTDKYNNIVLKFSEFKSDTDKIVVKYRTVDDRRDFLDVTTGTGTWRATWTSTTTFTTTQEDMANAVVGDEVEFLRGGGAGILAHITAISLNAGTYTVTIDEAYDYYTAGDLATFIFRNWKKWKTITYGDINANQGYLSEVLGVQGKFIQLKIELRGVQTRIESLSIDNKYHLPSVK